MNMYIGLTLIVIIFFVLFFYNMKALVVDNNKKMFNFLLSLQEFPVFYEEGKNEKIKDTENVLFLLKEIKSLYTALESVQEKTLKQRELQSNLLKFRTFLEDVSEHLKSSKIINEDSSKQIENIKNEFLKIKTRWTNSLTICFFIHVILFTGIFLLFVKQFT
jgi:hypothetical protein